MNLVTAAQNNVLRGAQPNVVGRLEKRLEGCSITAFFKCIAVAACLLFGVSLATNASEGPADAMGPLSVCPDNGRYFCKPSGKVVFLAGSHTWNNLVDMGAAHPPPRFDFNEYLNFLEAHNLNVIRLWTWETAQPEDWFGTPLRKVATPLPWPRTGPGLASDGRPRFDLSQFNPDYFERLRERVAKARERGFYVIVMLFEGWSVQMSPGRNSHPFHPENNVNGTEFLADVNDIHTLKHPEILAIQERYVEKVIRTLSGMDNLLFEIVNEAGGYSTEWQYHMIDFVRSRLAAQGAIAPVGMSYQYRNGENSTLFASDADWIAPGAHPGFYRTNPDAASGEKVVIADTDHISGSALHDPIWPYKGLLRGLNLLYMDRYYGPSSVSTVHLHAAPAIRANLGISRLLADHLDIRTAIPRPELASSGYALKGPDWLLALATDSERLEVDLNQFEGTMQVEWLDTVSAHVIDEEPVEGGDFEAFYAPSRDGALLYLRRAESAAPMMRSLAPEAQAISRASLHYADFLTRARLTIIPWLSRASRNYFSLGMVLFAVGLAGVVVGLLIGFGVMRSRSQQ